MKGAQKATNARELIVQLAIVLARQAAAEDYASERRRAIADARCSIRSVQ